MKFRVIHGDRVFCVKLPGDAKVSDLRKSVGYNFRSRIGYPPRLLSEMNGNDRLIDIGIGGNELIHVEDELEIRPTIKKIPKDDSCLFNAIGYLLEGCNMTKAGELRQLVAQLINLDSKYTDAILGMPKDVYVEWILLPTSWGGAIELSVFSVYYQVEIISIDLRTLRLDKYGSHDRKALLLYDGSHYDAVTLKAGTETEITTFYDDSVIDMTLAMVINQMESMK